MDSLYPYGRAGADFAANVSPELILIALVVPILLGVYFLTKS